MIDANSMPQSVAVFGGGSEIAGEIVKLLVEKRCEHVVLCGPNFQSMEHVRSQIQSTSSAQVDLVHFDLSQIDDIEKVVNNVFSEHGPIDCSIVAGGVLGDQSSDESSPAQVARVATINYVGPAATLTAVRNKYLDQGYGQIIVLSSVAGERVRRSNFIYGSSKAALDGFALSLGESLLNKGIYTLVVRPGFVSTKMTEGLKKAPLSQSPAQVAKDVLRAIEEQKELIWTPVAMRHVMMVYRHLPRKIARRVPF